MNLGEDILRDLTLPEICELSRLGVDLLMAPQSVRDLTPEEKRRAVQTLGLHTADATEETRVCVACGEEKVSWSDFYVKGHDESGVIYHMRCKQCVKETQAKYRAAKAKSETEAEKAARRKRRNANQARRRATP
jgi:hypothetical protein